MSRAAAGTFTATVAVLRERVQAEAIRLESDGVSDAVVCRAPTNATLQQLLLAQDVASDDFMESLSELPDAVGVDYWVDHRVCMGEKNGQIHNQKWGRSTHRTEEGEAVDDVQRQPAHCKQPDYNGQRLGGLDLFL